MPGVIWCALLLVCSFYLATVEAVVGGKPSNPPVPDDSAVFIISQGKNARIQGIKDEKLGYYSFLGIRYAEPPVGPRRFQRPVLRNPSGELNATRNCNICPQADPVNPNKVVGHEDCLCINIYAPKMPGSETGSPIVFFIHGGNYRSGSSVYYGGQHLVQKDTILVSVQYRLGSLGFLSTGDKAASGNVGLFDVYAALNWVRSYISYFGGDVKKIVVMGQGSGGGAASLLSLSGQGRSGSDGGAGIAGVVSMSGAPLSPATTRTPPAVGKHASDLAAATNCPATPPERLVRCLRKMPSEKIVLADENILVDSIVDTQKFLEDISGQSGAGARSEGLHDARSLPPIVSEEPAESIKNNQKLVPMLTGVTSGETNRVVFGKYKKFLTSRIDKIKDFIKNDLVGGLKSVVNEINILNPFNISAIESDLTSLLGDYYSALLSNKKLSITDQLHQISEVTNDALFAFPSFASVRAWSGKGQAYLYSFQYRGNLTKGSHFLPRVALAAKTNDKDLKKDPAHGDELAYVFEPLDSDGNSMAGEVSDVDAKVRDNFVDLIAKFAHGVGSNKGKSNQKYFGFIPYQQNEDPYLKIDKEVALDKNFKFCQMAMWGNLGERLKNSLCDNLFTKLLELAKLPNIPLPEVPIISSLGNGQNAVNSINKGIFGRFIV